MRLPLKGKPHFCSLRFYRLKVLVISGILRVVVLRIVLAVSGILRVVLVVALGVALSVLRIAVLLFVLRVVFYIVLI